MTYLPIFAVFAALTGLMTLLVVYRHPRAGTLLAAGILAAGYIAVTELPGTPKPGRIEFMRALDRAQVLWFEASETKGIDVVVVGPRLYRFPYTEQLARKLHEGMRAVESNGGALVLRIDGIKGGEVSADRMPPTPPEPKQ